MLKNTGRVVEFISSDGTTKNAIVYDKYQTDMVVSLGKAMLTLTDEDYNHLDTPKILKNISKLKYKGFVD